MNLGILFPPGGSLKTLEKYGQKERFTNYYFFAYQKNFKKVFLFQYPKFSHRYLYTFLLPFLNLKKISQCHLLRVMQLTGAIPAVISKIIFKTPYAVTYGYDYQKLADIEGKKILTLPLNLLEKIGLQHADTIIVTSKNIKFKIKKKYPLLKTVLLRNGVDTRLFKPRIKIFNPKEIKILFVGRLEKQKNLKNLISAISLSKYTKKITLTLIGQGPEAKKLKQTATQKKVKTKFIAKIPHLKLAKEYQASDIFALLSHIEGQPKVLIEALSCGLPIVASNIPAHQEIIANQKNGLLTENLPRKIAQKIDLLITNHKLRKKLSRNARKTAVEKFNLQKIVKKEIQLLKKIASGH